MQVLKYRYERLRGVAGRIQQALGDLAGVGEKVQSLLSWRDPRYRRLDTWKFYSTICNNYHPCLLDLSFKSNLFGADYVVFFGFLVL